MNLKQAHWYPGHMAKAIRAIQEKLSLIDLLVVVIDARAMQVCMQLPIVTTKPILYVVTKTDLADPLITETVLSSFQKQQRHYVLSKGKTPQSRQAIIKALDRLGTPVWEKQLRKGFKKQPLKVMIIGVPNVGKSTLINLLAKQKRVNTENRPGTTRGQQWIRLEDHLFLLDTPGILPPKYSGDDAAMTLALIGAMPLKQLPLDTLAYRLYDHLTSHYPSLLIHLHGSLPKDANEFFTAWGNRHGWVYQQQVELQRVFSDFIQAFQNGELGKISLPALPV